MRDDEFRTDALMKRLEGLASPRTKLLMVLAPHLSSGELESAVEAVLGLREDDLVHGSRR
jgi:hypothetical protein